jgi:hypothetical protein
LRVKLQSAQSPLSATTIANCPSSFSTRRTVRGDTPAQQSQYHDVGDAIQPAPEASPDRLDRCQCNQSAAIGKVLSRQDRTIQIARPFSELKATLTVALPS